MRRFSFIMRTLIGLFSIMLFSSVAEAQLFKSLSISGVYAQWGYNREWYSKSNIHLKGADYDFTIHHATAVDKPDFQAIWKVPHHVTIPQTNFRIGVYLTQDQRHAIEINFDHTKYIMEDNKTRRISGHIHGRAVDMDTLITPNFVHFEHSDGANFLQINYVGQRELYTYKNRKLFSWVHKLGAGIVIPKSNVTIMGKQLDNRFHISGYVMSAETGIRYYVFRNFFLEFTGKAGFANYTNALTVESGKANHKFTYVEVIGLIGYDLHFRRKPRSQTSQVE